MSIVEVGAVEEVQVRGFRVLGAMLGLAALAPLAAWSSPRPFPGLAAGAVVGISLGSRLGVRAWLAATSLASRGREGA